MDKRNSGQLPGFITSDNLFGSSPLFLKQFQNHNGEIESLGLEHKYEIPVIKPRKSSQFINYDIIHTGPDSVPQAQPVPRTQRTIFFRNEDLLIVEDPVGLEQTPVPKPRPRLLSVSPQINTELSSWIHVDETTNEIRENNCGNSSFDRTIDQYSSGLKSTRTTVKQRIFQDDQHDSSNNFVSRGETGNRSPEKPYPCSIL